LKERSNNYYLIQVKIRRRIELYCGRGYQERVRSARTKTAWI